MVLIVPAASPRARMRDDLDDGHPVTLATGDRVSTGWLAQDRAGPSGPSAPGRPGACGAPAARPAARAGDRRAGGSTGPPSPWVARGWSGRPGWRRRRSGPRPRRWSVPPPHAPRRGPGRVLQHGVVERGRAGGCAGVDPRVLLRRAAWPAWAVPPSAPPMPLSASVSSLGTIQSLLASPARDLRQHLEVLVGEQLLVRVAAVDRVERPAGSPAPGPGPRGCAACAVPSARRIWRLLLALGGEDLRLLDALGGQDRGATVTLGAHLLLHRVLHRVPAGRSP